MIGAGPGVAGRRGSGGTGPTRVMWLADAPMSYNTFLFKALRNGLGVELAVWYSTRLDPDNPFPWADGRLFRRRFGLEWHLLKEAIVRRDILFVVAGWNDTTKFLVLALRSLLGRPVCLWTDTIRISHSFRHRVRNLVLRRLLRGVTAVMTTGEVGVRRMLEAGLCPPGVHPINFPYWVPLPVVSGRTYLGRGFVTFLCAGRLIPRKGFDLVIRAIAEVVRAGHVVGVRIAGRGPEEASLRRLAEDLGVTRHVELVGWVAPDRLDTLRLESDVLIHAVPEADPFGVAVLEALATGLPVIGSPLAGAVAERVVDGHNGIVVAPGSVSDLARAMARFAANPGLVAEMGRNARRSAEAWPVERGVETIRGLLGRRR